MSAHTDFETLKQQIVEVVTKDPTVKYIFLGWVQDQFAEKVDLNKILNEIKELREESNKRWEQSDKRWEQSDKRWEQSDKRWEESDKRFNAVQQEIKQLQEETKDLREETKELRKDMQHGFEEAAAERQALRKDMNKGFKQLSKQIDILGPRWGRDSEAAFRNGLISLVGEFFEGTVEKWRMDDKKGYVRGRSCSVELDIVISNGKCIVIEIKSKPSLGDITIFERTAQFYEQQTGRKPDRKVLIAYAIEPEARTEANACNIEIFDADDVREQVA